MRTLKWKCFCWGIPSETSMLTSFEVIFPLKKSLNNIFLLSIRRVIKNVFHEKQEKIDYFYPFQLGKMFHLFIGKRREIRFEFLLVCYSFPNILLKKTKPIPQYFYEISQLICYFWMIHSATFICVIHNNMSDFFRRVLSFSLFQIINLFQK